MDEMVEGGGEACPSGETIESAEILDGRADRVPQKEGVR